MQVYSLYLINNPKTQTNKLSIQISALAKAKSPNYHNAKKTIIKLNKKTITRLQKYLAKKLRKDKLKLEFTKWLDRGMRNYKKAW